MFFVALHHNPIENELASARVILSDEYLEVHAKMIFRHLHNFRCAQWRASQYVASQSACYMGLLVLGSSRGTSILNFGQK